MANLNKVMLIGRLTRDPEMRTFSNGGKVAMFGFAVNNRKKNPSTGQWEDDPVFLDVEAFNRGEFGKQADLVEQYLSKGRQVFLEGHLKMNQWTSQDGQKRSKLLLVIDNMQFLDSRQDGEGGMRSTRSASAPVNQQQPQPSYAGGGYGEEPGMDSAPPPAGGTEDIPF